MLRKGRQEGNKGGNEDVLVSAMYNGRTMIARTKRRTFQPLLSFCTSHSSRLTGNVDCVAIGGLHDREGIMRMAATAATTDPNEKNMESEVNRWRFDRGSVSNASVWSVGILPCCHGQGRGVSQINGGYEPGGLNTHSNCRSEEEHDDA